MTVNKDTAKALDAATTLIKYCKRYKNCNKCVFYTQYVLDERIIKGGCAINRPFSYKEIKEDNK